jgi:copper chaperone
MSHATDLVTANYIVAGMTCDHCAASVREEVGAIAGVRGVDVDVPTGRVTVTSDAPLSAADLRRAVEEAVEEAGYRLAAG